MKKRLNIILISLALLGLLVLVLYLLWPRTHEEIQVLDTKKGPGGRWTAVLQMEVTSAGFVTVAVYAVRLKGRDQKAREGDLIMNVPVIYPVPAPSIAWSNDKLVVTLAIHQQYQYFATPVDGVAIVVQHK